MYILIGTVLLGSVVLTVAWYLANQESDSEYAPIDLTSRDFEPNPVLPIKRKKKKRGRARLSNDVWRQRVRQWVLENNGRMPVSQLNIRGGFNRRRSDEFLRRNSDLFAIENGKRGTYISIK
jgi:hypothetical protein